MKGGTIMIKKKMTASPRRTRGRTVMLEIELPELSNEAAAGLADVLAQLFHRFEATYYAQILAHHDTQMTSTLTDPAPARPAANPELF